MNTKKTCLVIHPYQFGTSYKCVIQRGNVEDGFILSTPLKSPSAVATTATTVVTAALDLATAMRSRWFEGLSLAGEWTEYEYRHRAH